MRWLFALPALAAAGYWLLALAAGIRRLFERDPATGYTPAISILKPLHGREPGLYEALSSHALQQYPDYQILFGLNRAGDPALEDARRVATDFTNPPGRVRVFETPVSTPNGKAGVLARLAAAATGDVLLVNDSDIRVEPDYLSRVVAPLADPNNGVVTCLYRARARHWPARMEALGIATDFAPSVLVSRLLGINRFALGSTMVFRASELAAIGGFDAVAEHIADDYELGRRIAALGFRVVLSRVVVETGLQGQNWGDVWRHQLRWARTIRRSQAAGYVGLVITNATLWSLVALAGGTWPAAAAAFGIRLAAGLLVAGAVLRDRDSLLLTPLIPLRDLFGLAVWAGGLAGDTVEWRGTRMRLTSDGRIRAAGPGPI